MISYCKWFSFFFHYTYCFELMVPEDALFSTRKKTL